MDDGGKLTVGATNDIDYGDASSIFIGYDSGYKMSLKGGEGDGSLTWDGSSLTIDGDITLNNQASIDQTAFLNSAASGADVTLTAISGELAVAGGGIVMSSTAKIRAGQTLDTEIKDVSGKPVKESIDNDASSIYLISCLMLFLQSLL